MNRHAQFRKWFRYALAGVSAVAIAALVGQRTANAQSLTLDFTQAGVDINNALTTSSTNNLNVTSANSGATETFDVWLVVTPGSSGATNANLGILNSYWGMRTTVNNAGAAFTLPTGNSSGTATTAGAVATGSTFLSPFNSTSGFNSIGDRNSDGLNDISSDGSTAPTKSSTAVANSNGGTSPELGNGSNGGEAITGTNAGWAWEIATVSFVLPTIGATGTGTITLTPGVPTFASANEWTSNGGTTEVSNSTATADATQIGNAITYTVSSGGGGNASVLKVAPTTDTIGVLQNGTAPALTNIGLSETSGANSATYTGATVGNFSVGPSTVTNGGSSGTGAAGTVVASGSLSFPTTYTGSTATDGTFSGSYTVTNTSGSTATQGNLASALSVVVGNATDDVSGTGSFSGTVLQGTVASGGSYALLASASNGGVKAANGTLPGIEGSTAQILLGQNNQGSSVTVSMTWRSRDPNETPNNDATNNSPFTVNGTPTSPPLSGGNHPHGLISDVVDLYGMSSTSAGPTGTTTGTVAPVAVDPFALEMSFNPATLNAEGVSGNAMATRGNLYLASLVPVSGTPTWQNTIVADGTVAGGTTALYGPEGGTQAAVQVGSLTAAAMDVNTGGGTDGTRNSASGTIDFPLLESFAAFQTANTVTNATLGSYVGVWGVDPTNDEAWAVINHNSEFAVVPEPSTIALAALGLIGMGISVIKRRKLAA